MNIKYLGYEWNSDMDVDSFMKKNNIQDWDVAYELFNIIEEKYINDKYENVDIPKRDKIN